MLINPVAIINNTMARDVRCDRVRLTQFLVDADEKPVAIRPQRPLIKFYDRNLPKGRV